jgi:hypothetical protein
MFKLILTIFLSILNIIYGQQNIGKKYSVLKDVNVASNINTIWFITSLTVRNKMYCMAECNKNDECHTIVFSTSQSNDNCFLYNKNFELIELVQSNISNLYKKECKYKLLIDFIYCFTFCFKGNCDSMKTLNVTAIIDRSKFLK